MLLNRQFAEKYYTWLDYKELPSDVSYELHDGVFYLMNSPKGTHQRILASVSRQLENYLEGKKCESFVDLDTRLAPKEDGKDSRVYRPDILVICDEDKYVDERIEGAPDLIIEIWSPSTGGVDLLTKKYAYEEAGVREYWVVRDIYKIYQYLPDEKGEYEEFIHTAKSDILDVPVHIWNNDFSIKLGKYLLPFQK